MLNRCQRAAGGGASAQETSGDARRRQGDEQQERPAGSPAGWCDTAGTRLGPEQAVFVTLPRGEQLERSAPPYLGSAAIKPAVTCPVENICRRLWGTIIVLSPRGEFDALPSCHSRPFLKFFQIFPRRLTVLFCRKQIKFGVGRKGLTRG